jgi:hypothetical protein
MGIELLGGPNEKFDLSRAANAAMEVVTSPAEKYRRDFMRRRVCLYRDDFESVLQEQIGIIFQSQAVRERLYSLCRLAGYSSYLKRISDEVARPLYASPPTRHVYRVGERVPKRGVKASPEREAFNTLAKASGWNDAMDTAARLLVACSPVFIVGRVSDSLGLVFDVATGDTMSALPHPDRPTRAVALAYDKVSISPTGSRVVTTVVVDDTRYFEVNQNGVPTSLVEHKLGRLPIVEVHARGRWGSYWSTRGQDLEAAALALMVIDAIILKKHKSQSHLQLAAVGEGVSSGMPKNQVLDEESILMIEGAGGSIQSIDLQADPSGLLKTKETIESTVAANYGISRDRLNQKSTAEQNAALNERTAEAAGVMVEAEADAFDLLCRLSQRLPDKSLHLDHEVMRMTVDYRAGSMRLDPMAERNLWNEDLSKGRRSPLDDIYALNPEITTDEEAWDEMNRNIADRGVWMEQIRAMNAALDATTQEPGQAAQQNGANGPKVRDGEMTKDEAAEHARKGQPPSADEPDDEENSDG